MVASSPLPFNDAPATTKKTSISVQTETMAKNVLKNTNYLNWNQPQKRVYVEGGDLGMGRNKERP